MRAVVQRVLEASVSVSGEVISQIENGLMVFIGINQCDNDRSSDYIADKIVNLRIFEDDDGKMNRSLMDIGGAALIVSQFTLYGDARRGRRPSFTGAMAGEPARSIFEALCTKVEASSVRVERGIFGAEMQVSLINDGPVTVLLDSEKEF